MELPVSARNPRTSTYYDWVYSVLKRTVLNEQLAPGTHLDETKIASDLGISRTPVREALRLLAAEGLVVLVPHRGAYVARLSARDAQELYEVREALEGIGARLAALWVDPVVLAAVEYTLELYSEAVRRADWSHIMHLDTQFHDTIARASRNRRLMSAVRMYREQLRLLRRKSVTIPGRPSRSLQEMQAILSALRARDPDAAERAMRAHIRSVRDDVARELSRQQEQE